MESKNIFDSFRIILNESQYKHFLCVGRDLSVDHFFNVNIRDSLPDETEYKEAMEALSNIEDEVLHGDVYNDMHDEIEDISVHNGVTAMARTFASYPIKCWTKGSPGRRLIAICRRIVDIERTRNAIHNRITEEHQEKIRKEKAETDFILRRNKCSGVRIDYIKKLIGRMEYAK